MGVSVSANARTDMSTDVRVGAGADVVVIKYHCEVGRGCTFGVHVGVVTIYDAKVGVRVGLNMTVSVSVIVSVKVSVKCGWWCECGCG